MPIFSSYLKLGVGPSRNLNNHVQDGLLLVGIEGDIVEGRDGDAILLDVDAVLKGVGSGDLADAVRGRSHCDIRRGGRGIGTRLNGTGKVTSYLSSSLRRNFGDGGRRRSGSRRGDGGGGSGWRGRGNLLVLDP